MKKHIIGVMLFSLIVSAAIGCGLYNISDKNSEQVLKYQTPLYIPFDRSHCEFPIKRNQTAMEFEQAVYNVRTKQFNWELSVPQRTSKIALHFFVKDANGTHYLNTIYAPEVGFKNGVIKAVSSSRWLDRLDSPDNAYVIADYATGEELKDSKYQAVFDAAKATAITVDYGE